MPSITTSETQGRGRSKEQEKIHFGGGGGSQTSWGPPVCGMQTKSTHLNWSCPAARCPSSTAELPGKMHLSTQPRNHRTTYRGDLDWVWSSWNLHLVILCRAWVFCSIFHYCYPRRTTRWNTAIGSWSTLDGVWDWGRICLGCRSISLLSQFSKHVHDSGQESAW